MNTIEKITKFLPGIVDDFFKVESKTEILERGAKYIKVDFTGTGIVKIPTVFVDGLGDYYRTQENPRPSDPANYAAYAGNVGTGERDGFQIGGADVTWKEYKLQYCRAKQFRIDEVSNEESASVLMTSLLRVFISDKVIPEIDATRFSLIADATSVSLGNRVSEAAASLEDAILGKFTNGFAFMQENEVADEDQIIFVNPQVYAKIVNSSELSRYITQADYQNEAGVTFKVEKYFGRPIIVVPSSRFYTNVVTTNNGYTSGANSLSINYAIVSAKATLPIRKLEWTQTYGPEQAGLVGYYGYLVNVLFWHGLVIPANKVPGIYVSVDTALNAGYVNSLRVSTKAGSVQYAWKLGNYFTVPSGLRGTVYYSYSDAFTLGADLEDIASAVKANVEDDNTATSAQTTAYFGLVDGFGKVIATSGATLVTLERHA